MRFSDWSSDVCSSDLAAQPVTRIGFIGLGLMGEPMALNLLDAGQKLLAWTRTPAKLDPVVEDGAEAAASVEEILARCATDRKGVVQGTSGYVRVTVGGRRHIQKKKTTARQQI